MKISMENPGRIEAVYPERSFKTWIHEMPTVCVNLEIISPHSFYNSNIFGQK